MDDTNDIFGNPIPGQLLVPSGRPPDFVAVTMGGSEKIHGAGAGAGQGSGVVLEQMDMDTKVVAFGRSRQQSDATVRNGSDPSDLALDVELSASDVLIYREVVEAISVEGESVKPVAEKGNGSDGFMNEGRVLVAATTSKGVHHVSEFSGQNSGSRGYGEGYRRT
ncbi:hypothetical protein V6N12_058636 [Hibiscus sabdariffa]|uniref:Uncharacterized protein n=1 Tax=Hibiscus sabdariffa TaxID=183260 RepID=A0ABR2ESP9_9ROSI